jgi:hypothetical protein
MSSVTATGPAYRAITVNASVCMAPVAVWLCILVFHRLQAVSRIWCSKHPRPVKRISALCNRWGPSKLEFGRTRCAYPLELLHPPTPSRPTSHYGHSSSLITGSLGETSWNREVEVAASKLISWSSSSGVWHHTVWCSGTSVSGQPIASVLRLQENLLLWFEICNLRTLRRMTFHSRTALWGLRLVMRVEVQYQADWLAKQLTNQQTS